MNIFKKELLNGLLLSLGFLTFSHSSIMAKSHCERKIQGRSGSQYKIIMEIGEEVGVPVPGSWMHDLVFKQYSFLIIQDSKEIFHFDSQQEAILKMFMDGPYQSWKTSFAPKIGIKNVMEVSAFQVIADYNYFDYIVEGEEQSEPAYCSDN